MFANGFAERNGDVAVRCSGLSLPPPFATNSGSCSGTIEVAVVFDGGSLPLGNAKWLLP